jgi:hypothetical protein
MMPPHSSAYDHFITQNGTDDVSASSFEVHDNVVKKGPLLQHVVSNRSVSFALYDEVFEIPHINNLSDDEVDNVWMSSDELKAVRRSCINVVERMNAGEKGLCTRGLEQHNKKGLERTTKNKKTANDAVFGIQKFQQIKGVALPELLAELYIEGTKTSQLLARIAAMHDAEEAYC